MQRLPLSLAGAILLVGDTQRRLHDRAGASVHIKLAARKPAGVGGVGGVEQQQRRLAAGRGEIEAQVPRPVHQLGFESSLLGNAGDDFRVKLEQDEFVLPGL